MAWERRGNGSYYYKKRRKGNRVISEYVGNGSQAQLVWESERMERAEEAHARAQWQQEKSEIVAIEAECEALIEMASSLMQATLLVSGYYPYKGQWRKKRNG